MKVYHLYDETGKWMTVTQNKAAIRRKIVGVLKYNHRRMLFFEETVTEPWVVKPKAKPATGCKSFSVEQDMKGNDIAVEEAA